MLGSLRQLMTPLTRLMILGKWFAKRCRGWKVRLPRPSVSYFTSRTEFVKQLNLLMARMSAGPKCSSKSITSSYVAPFMTHHKSPQRRILVRMTTRLSTVRASML